ncbi:MAG TPA: ABC transporter substrate-binding protein [Candidatus Binatia bacterium]
MKMKNGKLGSFVLCALFLAIAFPAQAQPTKKVPRIGFLDPTSLKVSGARIEAFRQGLSKLGYVESKTIAIEYRFADGNSERLGENAVELVRLKVDVIVTRAIPGAVAAKRTTTTIPIVFVGVADAVAAGLVGSLSRPGGNVTGLTSLAPELSGKRLELLKETFPKGSRIGVFRNPSNRGDPIIWNETQAAAQTLGLQLQSLEARNQTELENAFDSTTRLGIHALLAVPDPFLQSHRKQIVDFAAKTRLPAIYTDPEYVEDGGLMSYAANPLEFYTRAATFVDRILKGEKPGDIPIEQPTKFELVINLKTAKLIGLTIPPNVLARADKVIK